MKIQKNLNVWMMTFMAVCFAWTVQAQDVTADSTGLPGDNFSLEGALELFKKAKSPEDFEKLLNTEDNYVNNLDLNEDGDVDYIRVIDNMEDDVHAIVLQVPVTKEESQDIAVIEIEKTGPKSAMLQIIGDPDIYGEEKIVEPFDVEEKATGKGPSADLEIVGVTVNVYGWSCVGFIYRPTYTLWVSPFYFGYYPRWWITWRPRPWRVFYPRVVVYRPRYRVVTTHRVVRAHKVYTPRRKTSKVVTTRTTTRVAVKGKNGTVVAGKKTTTTKAGVNKKGNVAAGKKTTTTKAGVKKNNGVAAGKKTTTTKAGVTKNGKAAGKKTTTTTGVRKKNGNVAAGKKTTTTKKYKGKNNTVTRKKSTTTGVKKGRNGAAAGRKTTTRTTRKRKG